MIIPFSVSSAPIPSDSKKNRIGFSSDPKGLKAEDTFAASFIDVASNRKWIVEQLEALGCKPVSKDPGAALEAFVNEKLGPPWTAQRKWESDLEWGTGRPELEELRSGVRRWLLDQGQIDLDAPKIGITLGKQPNDKFIIGWQIPLEDHLGKPIPENVAWWKASAKFSPAPQLSGELQIQYQTKRWN